MRNNLESRTSSCEKYLQCGFIGGFYVFWRDPTIENISSIYLQTENKVCLMWNRAFIFVFDRAEARVRKIRHYLSLLRMNVCRIIQIRNYRYIFDTIFEEISPN